MLIVRIIPTKRVEELVLIVDWTGPYPWIVDLPALVGIHRDQIHLLALGNIPAVLVQVGVIPGDEVDPVLEHHGGELLSWVVHVGDLLDKALVVHGKGEIRAEDLVRGFFMVFWIFTAENEEVWVVDDAGAGVNEDVVWFAVLLIEVELIVAELLGIRVESVDLIGAVTDLVE